MSVFNPNYGDSILTMSSSNTGSGLLGDSGSGIPNNTGGNPGGNPVGFGGYNTNRKIVHEDGNWSNTIRSLFVYGTDTARY
jgi:hypothetical protein